MRANATRHTTEKVTSLEVNCTNLALRWSLVGKICCGDVRNVAPGIKGLVVVFQGFLHPKQLFVRLPSVEIYPAKSTIKPLSLKIRLNTHEKHGFNDT